MSYSLVCVLQDEVLAPARTACFVLLLLSISYTLTHMCATRNSKPAHQLTPHTQADETQRSSGGGGGGGDLAGTACSR